jgi:hypothetical protein
MAQDFDLLGAAAVDGDEHGIYWPLSHDANGVRD